MRLRNCGTILLALFSAVLSCGAAPVALDALDSGFYFANGTHAITNQNHLTGLFGTEHRSFFVFDLSAVSGTINSATLRLFNPLVSPFQPGYSSPDPTETLNLYDVTTPVSDITGNLAGVAGFNDLGSGTVFGTRIVSAADNGTIVEIVLNGSALAALNGGTGLFAIGGAITTLSGPADQFVFGFSMAGFVPDHTRQLVLDVTSVPEPSTAAFAVVGLAAALVVRKNRP